MNKEDIKGVLINYQKILDIIKKRIIPLFLAKNPNVCHLHFN